MSRARPRHRACPMTIGNCDAAEIVVYMSYHYRRVSAMRAVVPAYSIFHQKNIFVVLTYRCNAFCQKCITRYNRFRDQSMQNEDCVRLANLFVENHYAGTINMGSGESLLHSELPNFVDRILNGSPNVSFRILSNGKLFSFLLPKVLFDPRVNWGITLDGFCNADLVGLQQGVDIDVVKKNIESVCNAGFSGNLYLNYTLNRQNVNSLKAYIDFACGLGIPDLYVTEMKVFKKFENLDRYRISAKDREMAIEMLEYAKTLPFRTVGSDLDRDLTLPRKCFKRKENVSPIIDLNGMVTFCSGQEDAFIGNVFDPNTLSKWNDMFEKMISDAHASVKWCSRCFAKIDNDGYFSVPLSLNPYLQERCCV